MTVELFGSSVSGFALVSSNVNLNLNIPGAQEKQVGEAHIPANQIFLKSFLKRINVLSYSTSWEIPLPIFSSIHLSIVNLGTGWDLGWVAKGVTGCCYWHLGLSLGHSRCSHCLSVNISRMQCRGEVLVKLVTYCGIPTQQVHAS